MSELLSSALDYSGIAALLTALFAGWKLRRETNASLEERARQAFANLYEEERTRAQARIQQLETRLDVMSSRISELERLLVIAEARAELSGRYRKERDEALTRLAKAGHAANSSSG